MREFEFGNMFGKMSRKRCHENDEDETNNKKTKPTVFRRQTYIKAYNEEWKCLMASKKGAEFVHCTLCNSDFSCGHGGRNDCEKHVTSKIHKKIEEATKGSQSLKVSFASQSQKNREDFQLKVTNAETLMCRMMAENNLSLASADRLTVLFKEMFPDSRIAQGIQCHRNKATVLIKEMSGLAMSKLARQMKERPFSLATDGSNEGESKQFPLVIRTFDTDQDGKLQVVVTELLAVRNCEGSATGLNIFELIDAELKSHGISWGNCVSFGSDNAPVMTGRQKGVFSYITKQNAHVYLAACSLHLVHIAAKKGAACLPSIEEILIDIYYFFKKSSLRQSNLKELQELYDVQQRKMLKHGCTRWLSIARCIKRLLDNWQPLCHLFLMKTKEAEAKKQKGHKAEETENDLEFIGVSAKKLEAITLFLRSPTNKLYTMFLSYTLQVYDDVLVKLQADKPLIHELGSALLSLLKNLFTRFLKPQALINQEIVDVKFHLPSNQKVDGDLLIGDAARNMIEEASQHHLRQERISKFYKSVRMYFVAVCTYLIKKLPLSDPVLLHAVLVDPSKQTTARSSDLRFFLKEFPALLPKGVPKEKVEELFSKYQSLDISTCLADRVDQTWVNISNMYPEYKPLCEVMLGICTIPHSSAACERVFSCVRKTKTEQRASLKEDTLEALLVLKSQTLTGYKQDELVQLKRAYSVEMDKYKKSDLLKKDN